MCSYTREIEHWSISMIWTSFSSCFGAVRTYLLAQRPPKSFLMARRFSMISYNIPKSHAVKHVYCESDVPQSVDYDPPVVRFCRTCEIDTVAVSLGCFSCASRVLARYLQGALGTLSKLVVLVSHHSVSKMLCFCRLFLRYLVQQ